MGLIDGVVSGLLLILLLLDCAPLLLGKPVKRSKNYPGRVSQPRTVAVQCHEGSLEIVVKADLYGTGVLIDGADLRLGQQPLAKGAQTAAKCGAVPSGEGEYVILADLTDCGTELEFTDDWLVYKNAVFYSPAPLPDGIVRLVENEIPFMCHYRRLYSVNSNVLVPTWVPFISTQSAEDQLYFSLRLMTEDWRSERSTNVYFLGEAISLEASVVQGDHVPLRVFVDTCMATLVPDVNSDPRYVFIENGCLTDARLTESSSHYLPRTQDNKLHIHLEAFRFYQYARDSVFITCLLKAEPVAFSVNSPSGACSYLDGRWIAVDGNHQACGSCGHPKDFSTGKKATESGIWKRGTKAGSGDSTSVTKPPAGISASEKIVTIGPLIFHGPEQVDTPEVLATGRSGTSEGTPVTVAAEGGAVDLLAVTTDAATVVDNRKVLPSKRGNVSVEGPAVFVAGEVEGLNNSTLPLTGRSASFAEAPLGLSPEEGIDLEALAASAELADALNSSVLMTEQVDNLNDLQPEEPDTPMGPVKEEMMVGENELEGSGWLVLGGLALGE